jgi:2'-5' RNA ligase
MSTDFESSLVIMVPEADHLVMPFRTKYDSIVDVGIPSHITINYPFKLDEPVREQQILELIMLFEKFHCFRYSLSDIRSFSNSIYLAPDPAEPFLALSQAVIDHYPESLPYEGKFGDVIPHLTLAEFENPEDLPDILEKFRKASSGYLPIYAQVNEVLLMDNRSGNWETRQAFAMAEV